MRVLAFLSPFICTLLILCLLPLVSSRPRALSKQERIASILAQKPMHTTALLAGAAMPTPSPYPPEDSDLGYTQRPPRIEEIYDDDDEEDEVDGVQVELRR
ncbi:MAG: hypothetical protein Q9170_005538 [Blastenia crenularia]